MFSFFTIRKQIATSALFFVLIISLVVPQSASAQSLQQQIDALLAQISSLQQQIANTSDQPTVPTVSAGNGVATPGAVMQDINTGSGLAKFSIGARVVTTARINARDGARGDVVFATAVGEAGTVIDGPEVFNGFTYYNVRFDDAREPGSKRSYAVAENWLEKSNDDVLSVVNAFGVDSAKSGLPTSETVQVVRETKVVSNPKLYADALKKEAQSVQYGYAPSTARSDQYVVATVPAGANARISSRTVFLRDCDYNNNWGCGQGDTWVSSRVNDFSGYINKEDLGLLGGSELGDSDRITVNHRFEEVLKNAGIESEQVPSPFATGETLPLYTVDMNQVPALIQTAKPGLLDTANTVRPKNQLIINGKLLTFDSQAKGLGYDVERDSLLDSTMQLYSRANNQNDSITGPGLSAQNVEVCDRDTGDCMNFGYAIRVVDSSTVYGARSNPGPSDSPRIHYVEPTAYDNKFGSAPGTLTYNIDVRNTRPGDVLWLNVAKVASLGWTYTNAERSMVQNIKQKIVWNITGETEDLAKVLVNAHDTKASYTVNGVQSKDVVIYNQDNKYWEWKADDGTDDGTNMVGGLRLTEPLPGTCEEMWDLVKPNVRAMFEAEGLDCSSKTISRDVYGIQKARQEFTTEKVKEITGLTEIGFVHSGYTLERGNNITVRVNGGNPGVSARNTQAPTTDNTQPAAQNTPTPSQNSASAFEAVVEHVYTCVLDRSPEPSDLSLYADLLQSGANTPSDVIRAVLKSEEYQNMKKSDEELLQDVYACSLFRSPNSSSEEFWLMFMEIILDRNTVIDRMLSSKEFKNKVDIYEEVK